MRSAVVTFTNRSGESNNMKTTQILIVDDDRDFADSIADVLEEEGYKTLIAYSGPEAIEIIKQQKTKIKPEIAFFQSRSSLFWIMLERSSHKESCKLSGNLLFFCAT